MGQEKEDIQVSKFNTNSQPYYANIDTGGNLLNQPIGTLNNISAYLKWLEDGSSKYK